MKPSWSARGAAAWVLVGVLPIVLSPVLARAQARATPPNPFVPEEHAVTHVSEHVYMIPCRTRPGVPNVVIVVGSRATLVFDTGMGRMSGEVVVREVQRLTTNQAVYLSTTDLRPEHTTGAQAFPPGTVWVVPDAQRSEIRQETMNYVNRFIARSAELKDVLHDVKLPDPAMTFDREARIDLGGVTARLMWLGPVLTRGDTVIMIEEDGVLLAGNIVHSKAFLGMPPVLADVTNWIAALEKVEAMRPRLIVPNHGDVRDPSIIGVERELLRGLQSRSRELKGQGRSAEEAGQALKAEFQARYPDWTDLNAIPAIVGRFYAAAQ